MEKCFKGMEGAFAAMYTPFKKDGSLNEEMIEQQIEYGIRKGLKGFYLTGSTGESFLLTKDERKRVYNRAVKAAKGRVKLIAHVGAMNADDACELAKAAAKAGVDWVSAVGTVYFGQCFDANFDYYKRVSNATDLPFMIYSLGADVVPDRDTRFFTLKNVKGLKYTNYKYWNVAQLRNRLDKEAVFFAGADEQVLNALASGFFAGCIGTSDNMYPEAFVRMCDLAKANDFAAAQPIMADAVRHVELMIAKPNFTWHKSMMKYLGLDVGEGRAPAGRPLAKGELKELFDRMDKLGLYRRNDAKKVL